MSDDSSNALFEPKIIGFLCIWCAYAGADKAGSSQEPYPPNLQIIRVTCSGRVDPQFVLSCFQNGADGVMIMACHPGDCHYKEGNCRALQRQRMLLRILRQFGIEEQRCRLEYISANEGGKFREVVTDTVENLKKLGKLRHALPLDPVLSAAAGNHPASP
ncbi:MAG: hydrogenase iron-sulfur subunit [Geobacter sp.]|nr:hydrogenase iron-sulfur subunit [Geobacter sp.]